MGRRKLPSIPSHGPPSRSLVDYSTATQPSSSLFAPSSSVGPAPPLYDSSSAGLFSSLGTSSLAGRQLRASSTTPAPVYINSSAPPPVTTAVSAPSSYTPLYGQQTAGTQTFPDWKSQTGPFSISTFDLSRPGSSLSVVTQPSPRQGIDPAILPGATYSKKSPRPAISQIHKPARVAGPARVPSSLAKVLLKKELKEALSNRREKLAACDIEANQRQYVVHRMLVTGLLPEGRPDDDTPKVIPCLLPLDLIDGARVIPPQRATVATQKNDQDGLMFAPSTSLFPIPSSAHFAPRKDTAVQASTSFFPSSSMPTTSLRLQMDTERNRQATSFFSSRQDTGLLRRQRSTETQTEGPPQSYQHSSSYQQDVYAPSSSRRKKDPLSSTDDLIESTRRYFAEYDRQLREAGDARRYTSAPTTSFEDATDVARRENKKLELMEELARRRERLWSMMDLAGPSSRAPPTSSLFQRAPQSDYASTVPHYGSLPRIDYPLGGATTSQRPSRMSPNYPARDFTATAGYYGSLPRNYERNLGGDFGVEPIRIDYEQSFGARPRPQEPLSRSLYDLQDPSYSGYGASMQRLPPSHARSAGYIDRLADDRLLTTAPPLYGSRQFETRPFETDLTMGTSQGGDMISQYANYLSNDFEQSLGRLDPMSRYEERLRGPPSTWSDPAPRPQPSMPAPMQLFGGRYEDDVLTDPLPSVGAYPTPSYTAQTMPVRPYGMGYQDPYSASQVYSRSENNYGARPTYATTLDYGNLGRRTQQPVYPDAYNQAYATGYEQPPPSGGYASAFAQRGLAHSTGSLPYEYPRSYTEYPRPYTGREYGRTASDYGTQGIYDQPSRQDYGRGARSWSNGNIPSGYEREDPLSRVYATVGRQGQRRQQPEHEFRSLGRLPNHHNRHEDSNFNESMSKEAADWEDPNRFQIKRILLTRHYRDHNVYNDLGLRVVGGKRMPNGELGAFVASVHKGRMQQTLGEIKEGDQVLEWNGVLLNGKTFEEVERIINASKGEIEVILRTECERKASTLRPSTLSRYGNKIVDRSDRPYDSLPERNRRHNERAPPVPAHRCVDGKASPDFEAYAQPAPNPRHTSLYAQEGQLGYLQVSLSYERSTSRLLVRVISARSLKLRQSGLTTKFPNPFVKIYLLPGRKVSNKRRTRLQPNTVDPEWNQLLEYEVQASRLHSHYLEFTLWDYDRFSDNNALGQVVISLSERNVLNGQPRWYPIQPSEGDAVVRPLAQAPPRHFENQNHVDVFAPQRDNRYGQQHHYHQQIGYPAIN